MSPGKHPRLCTVEDQLTVTNAAGEVVKTYYKTSHVVMGQKVMEHEVCDTTIARGMDPIEFKKVMEASKCPTSK
jgi:hypothetical protein